MPLNRVLFRVDANATIGWGHFYRSLALAQMLTSDFEITFAMSTPRPEIEVILEENRFKLIALPNVDYSAPDDRGDQQFQCDLHGHLSNIDMVVTDGYWFREDYQAGLRKENVKIAVIEDDGEGEYDADVIINHVPGINQSDYAALPNTRFALGLDYALLRPAFIQEAALNIPPHEILESFLICFGGSDAKNLTHKAAEIALKFTKLKAINIIIGSSYLHFDQLNNLVQTNSKVKILRNLTEPKMRGIIRSSDFGIVSASTISIEMIACNRVPILCKYVSNQAKIYNHLSEVCKFPSISDEGIFDQSKLEEIISQGIDFGNFEGKLQELRNQMAKSKSNYQKLFKSVLN